MADFTSQSISAGVEAVVQHDAGADANVAGDKNQRVRRFVVGEFIFTQHGRIGFVLNVQGHVGQAGVGKCLGHQWREGQIAPTQVGGKTQDAAGLLERAGQAQTHARALETVPAKLAVGLRHEGGHLCTHCGGRHCGQRLLF